MKSQGVNYDVGTHLVGYLNREVSLEKMQEEIEMIEKDLHANSIRIYGMEKDKLHDASKIALDKGMEVWYSPRHINLSPDQTLKQIAQYAKDAETLRKENPNIIFVLGNEFTLDVNGFFEGKYWVDRHPEMGNEKQKQANTKLKTFLKKATKIARENFGGKITYASGFWEDVDWNDLDFVSVNKYMFGWNKDSYERELKNLKQYGKPVVITEFGGGSFKGAYDRDEPSHTIVDWKNHKIKEGYERDEGEQGEHMKKLLNMFEKEGIYGAFPFTFVEENYPHKNNPREDLDMASYNLVKILEDGSYAPKKSFKEISKFYRNHKNNNNRIGSKGLEKVIAFLSSAFLMGSIFFFSPNITGRVIGQLNNNATNLLGIILLTFTLIAGFFLINKKIN